MIDRNMMKYPTQVKRIVDEGHSAGYHSVSHDIKLLYNSPEATVNEFEKCKNTLNELTGSTSNLLRLPYGSKPYAPKESYDALVNKGYKIWDWNLDTQDWRATTEEIINNVELYSDEHRQIVLLMHEKEQTVKALQKMIDILNSKGYTILPIEENEYNKNYWEQNLTS
jgi:peptidoglycan/xylan/chitin deacetylase (PgdA/CDA1 family)